MAIEKLILMNIVGENLYANEVIKEILLLENVQVEDAYNEIENFRFSMDVTDRHLDEILGVTEAKSGVKYDYAEDFVNKLNLLKEIFSDDYTINKELLKKNVDTQDIVDTVNKIYNEIHSKYDILNSYYKDLNEIEKSIKAYNFISPMNIEMKTINALNNFNYTLGSFSKDNITRLKNNYSEITAIVVHVGTLDENEVYVVIWPHDLETETNRILKSLNFNKIEGIKEEFKESPEEILKILNSKKQVLKEKIDLLESEVNEIKDKFKDDSNYAYSVLHLLKKIQEIKKKMAFSKEHFYFSGWIPIGLKEEIKSKLSKYIDDDNIIFNDPRTNAHLKPPTKLNNNWLFRPFELFIKMYGIPSYTEVDPTPFLSMSYLFLFGFMFGDVGQGFIFFLLGVLLSHFKGMKMGGIISRLGISSMFFGVLYGSIFGFETVIPALWLNPFHNINTMLVVAIAIGVIMLTIGYIYGMINKYKSKDYYNIILGQNGLAGIILFFCLILVALALFTGERIISMSVLGAIIIFMIAIIFMKEPLINKLTHRKNHKLDSNFFVEGFFEIFEILLSIFSNTLSFIRIGAFALNHVGLFIAFETLAHIINSGVGSTIVYIIGNIFIICLEGLIVGIQGLRLEYYELFSKYYVGDGKEFETTKL
jgi:V/A-type H+-transporting ATPase subunit I